MAGSGGWETLLSILHEASDAAEEERPTACPHDGEPYTTGPDGRLFCKFDGYQPGEGPPL